MNGIIGFILLALAIIAPGMISALPLDPPKCDISSLTIKVPGEGRECTIRNTMIHELHWIGVEDETTCGLPIQCTQGNLLVCKNFANEDSCEAISIECEEVTEQLDEGVEHEHEELRCTKHKNTNI